jgi:hypothetical protein
MGSYQAFELEELQADRSRSYAEFLRRPGLSMGVDVGADHRFVDVTEDLQVLVVFAPPDDPEA